VRAFGQSPQALRRMARLETNAYREASELMIQA
jgi:hypothetical protein